LTRWWMRVDFEI